MPNPFADALVPEQPRPKQEPIEEIALVTHKDLVPDIKEDRIEIIEEIELYRDLNQEQIDKLTIWQARQDLGLSVAQGPLVCRQGCIHQETCPLFQDNIHPLGKKCPVEGAIMMRNKRKWAKSLNMNLDKPDNEDAFDLKLLDDLASLTMLKLRAMNEMAITSPEIAETVVAGYVDDAPMEKVVLNPRVTLIEKLTKLELKIYSELLSTRKAKFQVAGRIDDLSRRHADLKAKMDEVRSEELKKAKENDQAIDAEYEVAE